MADSRSSIPTPEGLMLTRPWLPRLPCMEVALFTCGICLAGTLVHPLVNVVDPNPNPPHISADGLTPLSVDEEPGDGETMFAVAGSRQ